MKKGLPANKQIRNPLTTSTKSQQKESPKPKQSTNNKQWKPQRHPTATYKEQVLRCGATPLKSKECIENVLPDQSINQPKKKKTSMLGQNQTKRRTRPPRWGKPIHLSSSPLSLRHASERRSVLEIRLNDGRSTDRRTIAKETNNRQNNLQTTSN